MQVPLHFSPPPTLVQNNPSPRNMAFKNNKRALDNNDNQDSPSRDTKRPRNKATPRKPSVTEVNNDNSAKHTPQCHHHPTSAITRNRDAKTVPRNPLTSIANDQTPTTTRQSLKGKENKNPAESKEPTTLENLADWLAFPAEEASERTKPSLTSEEKQIVEKRNAGAEKFVAKEKVKDALRLERIKMEEKLRIQHQQEQEKARRLQEEERAREADAKKRKLEEQRAERRRLWAEQEAKLQNPTSFEEAPLCHQQHLMAEFRREMEEELQLRSRHHRQQRADWRRRWAEQQAEKEAELRNPMRADDAPLRQQRAAAGRPAHQHHR
ncbi:MAG: hypothetical protein JOS17DRAFT_808041, partial [Linnemannia elongata]